MASVAWGVTDFAGGMASRRLPTLVTVARSQTLATVLAGLLVLISGEAMPGVTSLAWSLVAGVAACIAIIAFFRAMAIGEMSLVAPLVAVIGASIPLGVGVVGGEHLQPVQLVGVLCGLSAVTIVSHSVGAAAAPSQRATANALPLVAIAGCAVAAIYLSVARATLTGDGVIWWPILITHVVTSVLTLAILAVVRPTGVPGIRRAWPLVVISGVGDLFGFSAFMLANAHGDTSLVVVLSSLYPVTTVILALLVVRERLTRSQGVGIALGLLGVVLIAA
jgi:drug/metabolite transporter (DMT)-like permease